MTDKPLDSLLDHDRKYAWDYFQLHSSQRIATFNFFITLATAVLAGLGTVLSGSVQIPALAIMFGIVLALFSFIFWKVDQRNKMMIKNAEEALKKIEQLLEAQGAAHLPVFSLFRQDDENVHELRRYRPKLFWKKYFSYTNSFNIIFVTFGVFGMVGAVWGIVKVFVP